MKSKGYGSCWAFAELVFDELKARGVSTRIYQYATDEASNHRSTAYLGTDGKWHDFPYRQFCRKDYTRYNWFWNFSGSTSGKVHARWENGKALSKWY